MTLRAVASAAFAALIAAACATAPPRAPRHGPVGRAARPISPLPTAPRPPETAARLMPLTGLPGWRTEDHAAAFAAFRGACGAARDPALAQVCRSARAIGPLDASQARGFFEAHFVAERLAGSGVLTGYFAPEYPARPTPDAEFSAPLRRKPAALRVVDGGLFDPGQAGRPGAAIDPGAGPLLRYPDRTAIEGQSAEGALAWLRPEDLFFLQVQGSGVLSFEDGRRMKALYAANNGRPFVAVANPMRQMGLLAADNTSGEAIRAWLAAHRGPDAEAIMRLNPRYAFFSLAPDDGRPPVGAANIPLPGGRALAVDLSRHPLGELFWIDAEAPMLTGAFPTYRRLALALDTGGAIKGEVRADLYVGQGQAAGAEAGRIRHTLTLYRLVAK
ncbi:MAG: MltA domain protein [Phenylobacterium sp.]|nr:MltA domain protein [Phenylobacterium sp.]